MAITRDYIYQADYTANAQALADWLSANAQEYFDSVTVSDGTVTCSAGDTVLLEITLTATNCTAKAITAAGFSGLAGTSGSAAYRVYYAWHTAHGIAISVAASAGNGQIPSLWVTKDAAGNTAIAAWTKFAAPTNQTAGIALMIASAAAASTSSQSFVLPAIAARTVLSPLLMMDNNATDLPYLFYTPYSQYNDAGILTVDGTEYLYSGCIALCDGEAGASGSTDLSNYYTRAQTDAKIAEVRGSVEEIAEDLSEIFTRFTVYLSPEGSDDNDGLTAGSPMQTVSAALGKYSGKNELLLRLAAGTYHIGTLSVKNKNLYLIGTNSEATVLDGNISAENCALRMEYIGVSATTGSYAIDVRYGFYFGYAIKVTTQGTTAPIALARAAIGMVDVGTFTAPAESGNAVVAAGGSTLSLSSCTVTGIVRASTCGAVRVDRGSRSGVTEATAGMVFVDGVRYSTSATEA